MRVFERLSEVATRYEVTDKAVEGSARLTPRLDKHQVQSNNNEFLLTDRFHRCFGLVPLCEGLGLPMMHSIETGVSAWCQVRTTHLSSLKLGSQIIAFSSFLDINESSWRQVSRTREDLPAG